MFEHYTILSISVPVRSIGLANKTYALFLTHPVDEQMNRVSYVVLHAAWTVSIFLRLTSDWLTGSQIVCLTTCCCWRWFMSVRFSLTKLTDISNNATKNRETIAHWPHPLFFFLSADIVFDSLVLLLFFFRTNRMDLRWKLKVPTFVARIERILPNAFAIFVTIVLVLISNWPALSLPSRSRLSWLWFVINAGVVSRMALYVGRNHLRLLQIVWKPFFAIYIHPLFGHHFWVIIYYRQHYW